MATKTLDSVKLMPELRDKLSKEMEQMTPEERLRFIRGRAASTALGKAIARDEDEGTPDPGARDKSPPGE
ncbi:MAG: hypothetical protein ACE5F1_09210 [Planctomycetota bacterium]